MMRSSPMRILINRLALVSFVTTVLFWAGGCSMPSLLIKPVANTNELEEQEVQPGGRGFFGGGDKVVVLEIEGMLINARSGNLLGLGPEENKLSLFTQQLDRAAKDGSVKAVVLRINSPGGTVTYSDTMYEML